MRGPLRGGDPPGGLLFGSIRGNRLTQQPVLVLRGTPAAIDEERDPVVRGICRCLAQGAEELRIEVGDTRTLLIEGRHAAWDGAVRVATRATLLTARGLDECWSGR